VDWLPEFWESFCAAFVVAVAGLFDAVISEVSSDGLKPRLFIPGEEIKQEVKIRGYSVDQLCSNNTQMLAPLHNYLQVCGVI